MASPAHPPSDLALIDDDVGRNLMMGSDGI
jgi:hypothetical protein